MINIDFCRYLLVIDIHLIFAISFKLNIFLYLKRKKREIEIIFLKIIIILRRMKKKKKTNSKFVLIYFSFYID